MCPLEKSCEKTASKDLSSESPLHHHISAADPLESYARSIVDSWLQGNGLLTSCRFLNAIVDGDGEDNQNPYGEDSHPWNGFGDQPWQQSPSPAQNQEQDKSFYKIKRPLYRLNNNGPERQNIRNSGYLKSEGEYYPS